MKKTNIELLDASSVIGEYIEKEQAKNEKAQRTLTNKDSLRKARNNCYNIVQTLEALQIASEIEGIEIEINTNSNVGVLIEVVVKSLLNRGTRKSNANEVDLVLANGLQYEIKSVIVGSSRKASALDFTQDMTLLIVSNVGIYSMKREYWEDAKAKGYINKEDRLSPKIFEYENCVQTEFNKRLTDEWGLNIYEKRN